MSQKEYKKSIAVYIINHHPLEAPIQNGGFHWLARDEGLEAQLQGLVGDIRLDEVDFYIDDEPAGSAWRALIENLTREIIIQVITHLAPLSSAQRQQLIGVCAQTGAHLVTPSDAGRNRLGEEH